MPGGYRNNNGTFYYVGSNGYWWTATKGVGRGVNNLRVSYDEEFAYYQEMDCENDLVDDEGWVYVRLVDTNQDLNTGTGYSVRCVQE